MHENKKIQLSRAVDPVILMPSSAAGKLVHVYVI